MPSHTRYRPTPASCTLARDASQCAATRPSQHPGGGEAARRRTPFSTDQRTGPIPSSAAGGDCRIQPPWLHCCGGWIHRYRRPRFVLPVTLLFLPVGHTRTWCRRKSPVLFVFFPAGTALRAAFRLIKACVLKMKMPLSAASAQALCAGHNFSSIIDPGSWTLTCAPYCVAGCSSWRYYIAVHRKNEAARCCSAARSRCRPCAVPPQWWWGRTPEFDSSLACHPTPALSDESAIIPRALHWTAGSEWLRPVKHPCVVACMGLGSLAGRRDGDERRRGARAGARCRPCRQEAQHSNSARVDFGDPLEALCPPMHRRPLGLATGKGGLCLCQTHLSCRKHYAQLLGGPSAYPPSASRCLSTRLRMEQLGNGNAKPGKPNAVPISPTRLLP